MSLEPPNLDDRRFQDLVDDAVRLARQRMPDWSPTGPANPGVTLIEVAAWMTDRVIYRLNRVPDRIYTRFLDLLGVEAVSASERAHGRHVPGLRARMRRMCDSAWYAGIDGCIDRSRAHRVQHRRGPTHHRFIGHLHRINDRRRGSRSHGCARRASRSARSITRPSRTCPLHRTGDRGSSCAIAIDIDCEIEELAFRPDNPPLVWEASDGDTWISCGLDHDHTGGLSRAGEVVLHLPARHADSIVGRTRAGWVRAQVLEALPGQPRYEMPPMIKGVTARTVGGSTLAVNASLITDEQVGTANGLPGGRFATQHSRSSRPTNRWWPRSRAGRMAVAPS